MAQVTCSSCSAPDEIMDAGPEAAGHEVKWKCSACGATNLIEGAPGVPGEGALNPAAAALTDEELSEAYGRRIQSVQLGGTLAPEGAASAS